MKPAEARGGPVTIFVVHAKAMKTDAILIRGTLDLAMKIPFEER